MKVNTKILWVLLFNFLYLVPALVSASSRANYEFVLYIGVVIMAVMMVMRFYFRYQLTIPLLWLLSFWGCLHMLGGLVTVPIDWATGGESKVLYNLWLIKDKFKFDQLVHAYGFGVSTWLIWQVLQKTMAEKFDRIHQDIRPTMGLLFLCMIGSMGLGAINEMVEFLAMVLVPETNVGGYVNTALDLVANFVGTVITAGIIYYYDQRKYKFL